MRTAIIGSLLFSSSLLVACGGSEPPPAAPPPSPLGPVASSAPAPAESAAAPAEPTPEEKKKAADLKKLNEDRAKWEAADQAELARWTPEMHAAAKAVAGKTYPDLHAALVATMSGKYRKPGNADRDKFRHPLETLSFFGVKPAMTVLEIGPGEGWYTELLAPAVAAKGKLIDTTADPSGPTDQRSTANGLRFKAFLEEKVPELFGKVQTVVVDNAAPKLDLDGTVDAALLMREVHGMVNSGTLDAWLVQIRKALKAGGVLGIEEHRAKDDAHPVESSRSGYVPQKWLVDHIEAAGFKLAAQSEINANAKDTKDYSVGVWALPPSLQLGDQDRDKYVAIGEKRPG